MTRKYWLAAEEDQLRSLYPDTPMRHLIVIFERSESAIHGKANNLGINRSQQFLEGSEGGRMTPGVCRGKSTQFQPGQTPWNSGMKGYQPGGRAPETQFRKGNRPHTWQPIGTERVSKDGYLERKVTDDGKGPRDFEAVHRLIWKETNGPIPPGHVIVFKDKLPKHENIAVDRLELISRADLARRNSIHRYPPEVKRAIRTLAKLNKTIRKVSDEK